MPSNFEAFRFEPITPDGSAFTHAFLSSYEFDTTALRSIAKDLQIPTAGAKRELADRIAYSEHPDLHATILKYFVGRTRTAATFLHIKPHRMLEADDPKELVYSRGREKWYGPLTRLDDPDSKWFIYPKYFEYSEYEENENRSEPRKYEIRWHCFARINDEILSLHWHGFSYRPPDKINSRSSQQFPYWNHVPQILEKAKRLVSADTAVVKLYALVLDTVLSEYRRNPKYKWHDDRIRAEAGGVSLNARAASRSQRNGKNEQSPINLENPADLEGLIYLAHIIRLAIENKLRLYDLSLPEPEEFDDEILVTLIKKFGSQSYELSLDDLENNLMFHAHCYFGSKPESRTADALSHLQFKNTSTLDDLCQLRFLLSHFDKTSHLLIE